MTLWRMIAHEITLRRGAAVLSLLLVALAVAAVLLASILIEAYDRQAQAVIEQKAQDTEQMMAEMEDDYRKITKRMGFNVMILPAEQNLADFFADDFAVRDMPQEYVHRLAGSSVITVQHLLPSLSRKITWPENGRTILLVGSSEEVAIKGADRKKPLQSALPDGQVALGYELHRSLGLQPGDTITLMGEDFIIARCHEQRGSKDDITLWMSLTEAQQLLDKEGRINAILALECQCAWADLPKVRAEIQAILPNTQVVEFRTQALARAESRWRAAQTAQEAVTREQQAQATLQAKREWLAALLVPGLVAGCAIGLGILSLINVRQRRGEIGILRAIGFRTKQVLALVLGRALVLGLIGAGLGLAVVVAATLIASNTDTSGLMLALPAPTLAAVVFIGAPVAAVFAAWLPALLAMRQDPAEALREA